MIGSQVFLSQGALIPKRYQIRCDPPRIPGEAVGRAAGPVGVRPAGRPRAPGQAAVAIMVSAIRSVRAASRVVTVIHNK